MSNVIRNLIFVVSGLALLASCGGSDKDNGNNGGNTPPLATITSQNAPTIAGVVAEEILEGGVLSAISTTGLPFAGSGSDAAAVLMAIASSPPPPGVLAASVPQNCAVTGTIDVTFTIANPLTLSQGDEFRFEFVACDDGSGTIVDGGMVMTVTAFEGDLASGLYRLGFSIGLSAFQITQNGETTGASGTVAFEIDTTMPPLTRLTLSTTALTTTTAGTTETVTDLTIIISEDQSMFPTAVSVQTSFRISSPRIGGDVIVSTSIALQSSGGEFPFAGEVEIRAAGNAVVVMIAIDSNTVRLEIDINGDGAPDETRDLLWTDLIAAADAA